MIESWHRGGLGKPCTLWEEIPSSSKKNGEQDGLEGWVAVELTEGYRFKTVFGLSHHLHVRRFFQKSPESLAKYLMAISKDDAKTH